MRKKKTHTHTHLIKNRPVNRENIYIDAIWYNTKSREQNMEFL